MEWDTTGGASKHLNININILKRQLSYVMVNESLYILSVLAGLPEPAIFEISGSGSSSRQIPAPTPTPTPSHSHRPKNRLRLQPKRAAPATLRVGLQIGKDPN